MLKDNVIVIAFNAKLSDGCDYATQTMKILGRTNVVYGLLLGEPITWKDILLRRAQPIVHRAYQSTLIRPLFLFPGQRFVLVKQWNYFFNAIILRAFLAFWQRGKKKILWFFEPWNMLPVWWALYGYRSLYDCVDFFTPLNYESPRAERYLIEHVDYMTSVSRAIANQYRLTRKDITVVPLGFTTPNSSYRLKSRLFRNHSITIGYIGGLNYRIDWRLLTRVVHALPHAQFVFVGPIQTGLVDKERDIQKAMQALLAKPNVRYVGDMPKSSVGGYLRTFDIGIVPYDEQYGFNRFSFPMKIMEYFWYGLPVVATDIKAFLEYTDMIHIESTPQGWIRVIRRLSVSEWSKHIQKKQRDIAHQNTWEKKIDAISVLFSSERHVTRPSLR